MNRRGFIKTSSVATASLASAPMLWGRGQHWKGANDRVNLAVIGIRGMGQSHIQEYNNLPNVRVAALCDVDANLFEPHRCPCPRKVFGDRSTPWDAAILCP